MKTLILLMMVFGLNSALADPPQLRYFIKGQNGRAIPVLTPRQAQEQIKKQKEKEDLKGGQGQDFFTTVEIKENKVTAWVRGCNRVTVGDLDPAAGGDAKDLARLKTLKNGQRIKLKMQSYGSCEVGGWTNN